MGIGRRTKTTRLYLNWRWTSRPAQPSLPSPDHGDQAAIGDDGEAGISPFLDRRPQDQKKLDTALTIFREEIKPLLDASPMVAKRWLVEVTRIVHSVSG